MAFRQQINSWRNPDLVIRFREVSLQVASLDSRPDVDAATREQARAWLTDARSLLQQRFFGILPYDRYDAVWAIVNQLRHLLCTLLPAPELPAVLADIRASTSYLGSRQREACERDLSRLEQELLPKTAAAGPVASEQLHRLRAELLGWSRQVAAAREAHWRKVNLLRKRLAVTGWLLILLLGAAFGLLPELMVAKASDCPLPSRCPRIEGLDRLQLGGVMLLGAIGGLVSALWTNESIHAESSRFYLQRTLLTLKPVIGAAMATFTILLEQAGIVSVLPSESEGMAAFLVLAFLSGFSERFVRTRIEAASNPAAASAASAGAEEPEPKGRKGR